MTDVEIETSQKALQDSIKSLNFALNMIKSSEERLEEVRRLRIVKNQLINALRDTLTCCNLSPDKICMYEALIESNLSKKLKT